MTDDTSAKTPPLPTLEDWQHWTWVTGRAQQMLMETWAEGLKKDEPMAGLMAPAATDPMAWMTAGAEAWSKGFEAWGKMLGATAEAGQKKDRRFASPEWSENPVFETIKQSYLAISDRLLGSVEEIEGIDDEARQKMRFATRSFVDAMAPSNFALTNPDVMKKTIETRGDNLLGGLKNMLDDIKGGQLTQTAKGAFEVGRNLAATPGKVVYENELFQLIHYAPVTETVLKTPVIVFPPWINRFYILDLTAEKSFIKWCVDQGITVFVVSWKSADSSMKDIVWDDYIAAQIDAIDTVRKALKVDDVHTIGYCVAGTTLAATLAILAAKSEADKVRSATFFTAQIDFSCGGELLNFIDDQQLKMVEALAAPQGYIDGRLLALSFNLLRGKDLIWSTVVKNYLLGEEYPAFDLLHWNGDVTNLPGRWHREYLCDLYRDNKLVIPNEMSALGTAIDLNKVKTPSYVQAGREDHIAPAESVWKIREHFKGPMKFVLAGSGHIAGVVNPPAQMKYKYWTNDSNVVTLDKFIEDATETKGSWWPDWLEWLKSYGDKQVAVKGGRIPGEGKLKALENAPGSYVKTR